jgi:hypothetical protein
LRRRRRPSKAGTWHSHFDCGDPALAFARLPDSESMHGKINAYRGIVGAIAKNSREGVRPHDRHALNVPLRVIML